MKIHEYQAKEILRKYGLPLPKGLPAFSVDEAEAAAKALIAETDNEFVVIKAQIHAGGRGKGGGVKVVKGASAARETAQKILGMNLVTHQTGPGGRIVKRLLIEQGIDIARELYLGLVVDRGHGRVVVMASSEGGMDIEEVAAKSPEKILREVADPVIGLAAYQARNLAYGLGLHGTAAKQAADFRHGQRNGERGSLVGLTCRTRESLPSTDDRQHRQNEQHKCHMAEPADKTAYFILVQTEILSILELLLNTPSGSNGPGHHLKCGTSRSEHQVIGLLGGIALKPTNQ